jgi:hydroxymethylglutaryl-CoA reductase (NADPH)
VGLIGSTDWHRSLICLPGFSLSLPAAIVSSGVLALLLSLSVASFARIPMDVIALSEALPFLVCTVGFDKPMRFV